MMIAGTARSAAPPDILDASEDTPMTRSSLPLAERLRVGLASAMVSAAALTLPAAEAAAVTDPLLIQSPGTGGGSSTTHLASTLPGAASPKAAPAKPVSSKTAPAKTASPTAASPQSKAAKASAGAKAKPAAGKGAAAGGCGAHEGGCGPSR